MKQFFLGLMAIGITSASFAQQKINEDSVLNLLQDDICTEVTKAKPSEFTAENFQMKLGMLFMSAFQKHDDALVQLYGDDYITNQDKMMDMGQKMGMQLAMGCKAFQTIIMTNPELVEAAMGQSGIKMPKKNSKTDLGPNDGVKEAVFVKVISYTSGDISFYTANIDGKNVKLYWLEKFDGDDELIANPKKIVGKRVQLSYKEQKAYNSVTKTYKKINVILSYSDVKFTPPKIVRD